MYFSYTLEETAKVKLIIREFVELENVSRLTIQDDFTPRQGAKLSINRLSLLF